MSGASHIRSVQIVVEYQNCCRYLDAYLLFANSALCGFAYNQISLALFKALYKKLSGWVYLRPQTQKRFFTHMS